MATIAAAELNYIIYRYLQESGFLHTAFNFRHEAGINSSPVVGNLVPPAALFKLVQLGIRYKEMQANAVNDAAEDLCVLQLMDIITKDVSELQQIVQGKKKNPNVAAGGKGLDKGNATAKDKKGNPNVASGVKVSVKGNETARDKKGNPNVASGVKVSVKGNETAKDKKGNQNMVTGVKVSDKGKEGTSSRGKGQAGKDSEQQDVQQTEEANVEVKKRRRRLVKKYQ